MTAIAGIIDDGKVYIGGDSAGVGGYSISTRSDPKVFVSGEFAFGYTTSFRMGQLIEHEFSAPKPFEGEVGIEYMVKRFIPSIKECFKKGGYQQTENGQDSGGTFLVGWRGSLYCVFDDYQVSRTIDGIQAIGCGKDLILGSLHTSECFEIDPEERIDMALDAACEFSAGVIGPYEIVCVGGGF